MTTKKTSLPLLTPQINTRIILQIVNAHLHSIFQYTHRRRLTPSSRGQNPEALLSKEPICPAKWWTRTVWPCCSPKTLKVSEWWRIEVNKNGVPLKISVTSTLGCQEWAVANPCWRRRRCFLLKTLREMWWSNTDRNCANIFIQRYNSETDLHVATFHL